MSRISELEDRVKRLSQKGLDVVEDSRPWSEKAAEVERIDADVKATLAEREDLVKVDEARTSFKGLADAGVDQSGDVIDTKAVEVHQPQPGNAAVKSMGEQFVDNEGFKAVKMGGRFSTGPIDVKATLTEAAGGVGLLFPQFITQPVPILLRRLTIAQLIPGGTLAGASLTYPKESAITNAAAAVVEGAVKPASDLNYVQVTETLTKVATVLKVSDETMQDYPAIVSTVNGRLALFVQLAEEDQLLNGSGVAPNMTGIMNRSGLTAAQAKGADTAADALYKDITKLRATAFIEPDGIVMHPTDWQNIRLTKDSQGQYYAGGPFTGAYGNGAMPNVDSIWGLPVVITPAITVGTALVGAFAQCAQVFRKDGLRVEATNSNEDDFLRNLVAIRAELRELLAVFRPAGFSKVTGL